MAHASVRPPRVAILINNPYTADSRVWKTATSLAGAGYAVTVVAREGEGLPRREERAGHLVLRVEQPRPLAWLPVPSLPSDHEQRTDEILQRIRSRLRDTVGRGFQATRYLLLARAWAAAIDRVVEPADVWQAESVLTLPLALALRHRHGGAVVYDANDIDTEAGRFARLPAWWRQMLRRRERSWTRSVDALVTVSEPYADVLTRTLGRQVDAIVRNGPVHFEPPDPPDRRFHVEFGLRPDQRVVLYLGQVMEGRGLEQLFEAIGLVQRAVLVVAGFGSDYGRFRSMAAASPNGALIHFMRGIQPGEIPAWTASADVSAMPVQPDTLNHRLNTPTKLFDAMGAGVPVVASDLPGITPTLAATGCGEPCDPTDPADIARAIRRILDASPEERLGYRERCLEAARGTYAWQRQAERLMEVYRMLGVRPPTSVDEPPRASS